MKIVWKILTGFLIALALALTIALGFMVTTIIRGESPRQLAENGKTPVSEPEDKTPVDTTDDTDDNQGDSQPGADAEPDADGNSTPVSSNGSGALGKYYIEIKSAALTTDFEGNPAIVITYSWTNNSEETTSADVCFLEKAFQNGIQIDSAIIGKSDIYDSMLGMKDIRPGATLDVQAAYLITSSTAIVEFEVSELFSLSDDIVSMDFDPAKLE